MDVKRDPPPPPPPPPPPSPKDIKELLLLSPQLKHGETELLQEKGTSRPQHYQLADLLTTEGEEAMA